MFHWEAAHNYKIVYKSVHCFNDFRNAKTNTISISNECKFSVSSISPFNSEWVRPQLI